MFFPLRDDNPTMRTPVVTIGLIAVNSLIFLFTWMGGLERFQFLIVSYGFTPGYFLNAQSPYLDAGTLYVTPFSSMFMHGGWWHLIGNMLFLWIFGNNVEDYFGPVKYLLFYLAAGLLAIAMYTLFNPHSAVPLVGASGAIAGVMGAYLVLHPRAEITCLIVFFFIQFVTLPAKVVLGIWFAIQLVMSVADISSGGGTAWLAHVGGFVFGWVAIKAIYRMRGSGSTPAGGQRVYKMQW